MSQLSSVNVSKTCNWSFAKVEETKAHDAGVHKGLKWFDIEQGDMPTSVHVELMKQGEIKDPYKCMHEYDVQVSIRLLHGLEFAANLRPCGV